MNHSYLLIGIRTRRLFSMIIRNRGISVRYILRVLFLINSGIWSDIFALREKRFLKKNALPKLDISKEQPIFIIGNWRTGSTFLHQLLAADKRFYTPNVFEVSVPDSMLTSGKYYYPIMSKALGETRPIDNVKIGFYEPQEDEYALLKLCGPTPLEDLVFPKSDDFFLNRYHDNILPDKEEFRESFLSFYAKLKTASGNKQLLFKNPFHSFRVNQIKEIFPGAKFIHIYRNPVKVVPSTIKMWDTVGRQNALKKGWEKPSVEAVSECYKRIILKIRKESEILPDGHFSQIKYEQLEKDPVQAVQNIYKELDIEFSKEYEGDLTEYLEGLKGFKKNSYQTPDKDIGTIKEILSETIPEYY